MRLLLFNLATDDHDPILGFTTRWVRALAARVDFIHVITMRMGKIDLPDNVRVHSVGKEKGYSEARRVMEFYKIIVRILREDRIDVCFSHMIPIFTILAAPILKFKGVPIVTWYCHPGLSCTLKVAHHVSDCMVSSLTESYPYRHDKLLVVGHGIDTDLFTPDAKAISAGEDTPVILCVGRLSPMKDHSTLIKAASLLRRDWNQPFKIVILGGPATRRDESYVQSLRNLCRQLELEQVVHFHPAVSIESLPAWYRRCAVHVNLSPTGGGDKVAWEAMSCGRPCLVANEGFKETLGKCVSTLYFGYGDAENLAARLKSTLSLSESERMEIGSYLRRKVESMHSLNRLTQNLVALFQALSFHRDSWRKYESAQDELEKDNV